METKKQEIESLLQAANNLKNVIYWLDKADKKVEVVETYDLLSKITGEVSRLSDEVVTDIFNG